MATELNVPGRPEAADLVVTDLHVDFPSDAGPVRAVDGLSFRLPEAGSLAIVGESGSGKSVSMRAVLGLLPPSATASGGIEFGSTQLLGRSEAELRRIRGSRIALVFQDALASLNPVQTVGDQIGEMYRVHEGASRRESRRRAVEMLDLVRIPAASRRVGSYPHEFSGGMRQRVVIAMALALQPDILIADEPTTALDVTVQAQILRLLRELQRDLRMGLILITHDLGAAAWSADDVVVMYAGKAVEKGTFAEVLAAPAHPYTRGLLAALPRMDRRTGRMPAIPGQPPNPARLPRGCAFHPRCPDRLDICDVEVPAERSADSGRTCSCHAWTEASHD